MTSEERATLFERVVELTLRREEFYAEKRTIEKKIEEVDRRLVALWVAQISGSRP